MTAIAFTWFAPGELTPVRVVSSRRSRATVRPPVPMPSPASTPVYDRLAWERGGDPLSRSGTGPSTAQALVAVLATAGAR